MRQYNIYFGTIGKKLGCKYRFTKECKSAAEALKIAENSAKSFYFKNEGKYGIPSYSKIEEESKLTGVDILGNTSDPNDISQNTLHLKRLYAKVSFKVQVGTAGAAAGIRKFVPDKWYVVNVPTCSYLMERTSTPYVDAATDASQFFSTPELGFETEELAKDPENPSNFVFYHDGVTKASCYGFAFYMMENRKAPYGRSGDPLPSPFNYSHRELEIKDGTGLNQGWRYASEYSTYIVMTGKIVMGVTSGSNANATLDANVKYKIHLGNFASDNADFNILRNHNYTYKIYINGSDDIKTEVETGTENAGETGVH